VTSAGEYEAGDVNTVEAQNVDQGDDDYEPGDVNTVAGGGSQDDDYDDADADSDADADADEAGGNRVEGGTPTTVLTYLARSLADEPDSVVVNTESRQGSVRLSLHVAPDDMGRVIGRRGRTAQALRTLVGVAGARDGIQTSVDIVDD
jgi:hypothetical protein